MTELGALCHGGLGPAIWEARSLLGMAEDCEFLPADDPLHERVAAEVEAWIPLFLGILAGCATVGEWRAWVARHVEEKRS